MANNFTVNFAIYLLLLADKNCAFLRRKFSQNSMSKKDDNVGNKTGCKKKGKGRKKR